MAILIKLIGKTLSCLPYWLLSSITDRIGRILIYIPSKRKKLLLSNLRYAFPDWNEKRRIDIASVSVSRMLEMGLFSLTYQYLPKYKKRHSLNFSLETENKLKSLKKTNKPILILLPHVCLFEAIAVSPLFRPSQGRKLGAIYRPNRNSAIDQQVKQARESTGLEVFSRKDGILKAKKHLSQGNWLVVLFDQNAGDSGTLDLFLNRIVSYTSLPNSLTKSTNALPLFTFPKRKSFFSSDLIIEEMEIGNSESVSSVAHQKLASLIRNDQDGLPEWLWSHGKWKVHSRVESRYQMIVKRKHVIEGKKIERLTNFFVRMPNWLGDIVMAIPVLLAIRKGRPDVCFTIVCKAEYTGLLKKLNIGESFIDLPPRSIFYFWKFHKKIPSHPDNYLLFTNSLRGDLEALISGAGQRFGMKLPGRCRPLLSDAFNPSKSDVDIYNLHQTRLLGEMASHFGLREKISEKSFSFHSIQRKKYKIGIVAGSSNTPEKRWAVANWVSLLDEICKRNSRTEFFLYGTMEDIKACCAIYSAVNSNRILNLAGETTLCELADELASCSLVIGNDTGSMHLANMLGTPVSVLFGPTNSTHTQPFFNSALTLIEPENSTDINSIKVADVIEAILEHIPS